MSLSIPLLATAILPPTPVITSRARLTFAIGDLPPQPLTVGLYGNAAPKSVALFQGLCAGTLGKDLLYAGSSVSRIERDKFILGGSLAAGSTRVVSREIDRTGYVRSESIDRADEYANDEVNTLSHDRAGLLSMKKGGAFEFALIPRANPALDATRIVIGECLDEDDDGAGLRLIASLNALPTRQPSAAATLGGVASLYALRLFLGLGFAGLVGQSLELSRRDSLAVLGLGSAGASFVGSDPRDQPDLAYRPLTKVRIASARLL